MTPRCIETW